MNDTLYTDIAERYLGIETLEERGYDDADFHTVAVWTQRSALEAAYLAGYAAAMRAAKGSEAALPTERHTLLGDVWLGQGEASDLSADPRARTVTTAPVPETALLEFRWQEKRACDVLIPRAVLERCVD